MISVLRTPPPLNICSNYILAFSAMEEYSTGRVVVLKYSMT